VADPDGTAFKFSNPDAHHTYQSNALNEYAALADFVEERNGNRLTVTDQNNGAFYYSDSAGRTVISSSGFGSSGNTLTVSGLPKPYVLTWTNYPFSFPPPNTTVVFQDSYCGSNPVLGNSQCSPL